MTFVFTELDFSDDFELREQALVDLAKRLSESPIDTRRALAGFTPQVDEFQDLVVRATGRTIRIIAPAGSGKTQTMVNRALYRIRDGLNPSRILMLTFDRAAVSSITQKLAAQLDELGVQVHSPSIKTLNALGYQVLRDRVPEEYRQIAENYRRRRLFREVKQALESKSPERHETLPANLTNDFFLDLFSLLKNELFDPRGFDHQQLSEFLIASQQAEVLFPNPLDARTVRFVVQSLIWMYEAYEQVLRRNGVLDFDDQKLRAFAALNESSSLRGQIQHSYDEIIVDEFQDINKLDFAFIRLVSALAALVVTGDDDQAIYGFRGCTPEYIINFGQHLGERGEIARYELSKNYRCPPNIVAAADRLIRHNSWRLAKEPVAVSAIPADIKVVSSLSTGLEARLAVGFIRNVRRKNQGLPFTEFAVLYRANAQSLPLQVEFILNGIPYFVRAEHNILENEMLDRLMGVLRVKLALKHGKRADPRDCVRTVQSYFQWVPNDAIQALELLFTEASDFQAAIRHDAFYSVLPKAQASQFPGAIADMLSARTLMDTLDVLAKRFKGLRGMIGSLEDVVENRVPLGEVYELAASFRGNIGDFVASLQKALDRARAENAGRDEEGGVRLSTYFGAKGLQWHTVLLVGCNEGLIPHSRAPIEDERRLFYVAMTRAVSNLLISYVKNVAKNDVNPSRFIEEAGLL